ncbi:MAG TPA: hypothetical protein VGK67_28725 [Myxococcales bacterium]
MVTTSLRGRGLSTALLDDLCARLAALGVRSVQAHFAFRGVPLSGFRLDKRQGGLVRDLAPAEGEALRPGKSAAAGTGARGGPSEPGERPLQERGGRGPRDRPRPAPDQKVWSEKWNIR